MNHKSARSSDKKSDAATLVLKEGTCPTSSGKYSGAKVQTPLGFLLLCCALRVCWNRCPKSSGYIKPAIPLPFSQVWRSCARKPVSPLAKSPPQRPRQNLKPRQRRHQRRRTKLPARQPPLPAKGNSSTNPPPLTCRERFGKSQRNHFHYTSERKAP